MRPGSPGCCGRGVAPRELDFPYYNLTNGYQSTLYLVSDSPTRMNFSLGIRSLAGDMLTTSEDINPGEKLSIDLASLITKLGGDPAGEYSEGSVSVYYVGTIMPVVGQISIRNPQLGMEHESEMVENDPGRSDIPPALNGVWWGLGSGRQAQVMVTNVGGDPAVADVRLDFQGKQHVLPVPLTFAPGETKVLDIAQLVAELGVDPSSVPEGGITIAQAGPHPSLIANGKITDIATGYSSTIYFPAPELEHASAAHASGLPVGTPSSDSPYAGTGTFVPHVIVRNLLSSPQAVTVTAEYPIPPASDASADNSPPQPQTDLAGSHVIARPAVPGDKSHHPEWGEGLGGSTGMLNVATVTLDPYSTQDFSLESAMNQLPLPLPFCSIRIQYAGAPGSVVADVLSVDSAQRLVVDAMVQNEGNGWAGSGANPWHLDKNTESVLFLTNEGGKPARIGFSITAGGVRYYLTKLKLAPHETRAINVRALRDAQLADFKRNQIPAAATDGSVTWVRIDNVPVMGRLMVISRHGHMAATYDCCTTSCPASFTDVGIDPGSITLEPSTAMQASGYADYYDCNNMDYPSDVTNLDTWGSDNTSVSTASVGLVQSVAGGTANSTLIYTGKVYDCTTGDQCAESTSTQGAKAPTTVTVTVQISGVTVSPTTMHTQNTPNQATVTVDMTYTSVASNLTTLPTVTLNVETYTTSNPNASLSYSPPSQPVTLLPGTGGSAVKTCIASSASGASSFVIQAVLNNGSAGVVVENPSPASAARAALSVMAP